jgi:PAS domain-containing protein
MAGTLLFFAIVSLASLLVSALVCYRNLRSRRESLRANAALKLRLEVMEAFVTEAVIALDDSGLVIDMNQRAEQIFGYPTHQMLGKHISAVIPEIPPSRVGRGVVPVQLADGSHEILGFTQVVSGNQRRYLRFGDGLPSGDTNRTGEMPALEAIESVVRRIVRQLEGLLTVVNGYTELALQQCDASDAIRKDLEEIAAASDTASQLVLHLLACSGNQLIPLELLDLNGVVERLQSKLPGIQIEFCAEDLLVFANAECLSHIIQLFAGSAQHRVGEAVPFQIVTSRRVADSAVYAVLAIADGGPALSPRTLAHLFEPLFLDREGVGVDLSAIHGMVRTLGGKITVASEANRGTVFEILIPLVESDRQPQQSRVDTPAELPR